MKKIDAHIHFAGDEASSLALLDELDMKILNICVAQDSRGKWREQADAYQRLAQAYPNRYTWCTTFDLPRFDDPQYVEKVIEGLEKDFANGAVACKAWKNLGMDVRTPDGEFFMVDDPLLSPIFEYLASRNKTLLMHIAEPLACWQPISVESPHQGYYQQHPEWHMYGKEGVRSHQELIQARDNVAARHPNLRVVGAHLASLEYDVAEIAQRFDRYPNFAVDISARLLDMATQDAEKVRKFCLTYPDRILLGTDLVSPLSLAAMPAENRERFLTRMKQRYREHFQYFESDGMVQVQGSEVRGISLPSDVLQKIYYENAARWYPGA